MPSTADQDDLVGRPSPAVLVRRGRPVQTRFPPQARASSRPLILFPLPPAPSFLTHLDVHADLLPLAAGLASSRRRLPHHRPARAPVRGRLCRDDEVLGRGPAQEAHGVVPGRRGRRLRRRVEVRLSFLPLLDRLEGRGTDECAFSLAGSSSSCCRTRSSTRATACSSRYVLLTDARRSVRAADSSSPSSRRPRRRATRSRSTRTAASTRTTCRTVRLLRPLVVALLVVLTLAVVFSPRSPVRRSLRRPRHLPPPLPRRALLDRHLQDVSRSHDRPRRHGRHRPAVAPVADVDERARHHGRPRARLYGPARVVRHARDDRARARRRRHRHHRGQQARVRPALVPAPPQGPSRAAARGVQARPRRDRAAQGTPGV